MAQGSISHLAELQTLEDVNNNGHNYLHDSPRNARVGSPSGFILNEPSESYLIPMEGMLSPIKVVNGNSLVNLTQFKLRSPVKATQQEINLTKRYIGVNE